MPDAKAYTQFFSALGAILGCIGGALLGGWLGRRVTYCLLCFCSLVAALAFFLGNDTFGWQFLLTAFILGLFSASFYGWLPLYLPELFTTRVRATGRDSAITSGGISPSSGRWRRETSPGRSRATTTMPAPS
jgi:MFS family permease